MTEQIETYFKDNEEFSDFLTFVKKQKSDPHVWEIGLIGSMVNGKGSQSNDYDVYEVRSDVRRNELWVNTSMGRRSGKKKNMGKENLTRYPQTRRKDIFFDRGKAYR